jgi:hypothetical protein
MITLHHATKIAGPRAGTYHALTDLRQMAAQHAGNVDGAIVPGQVLTPTPKPSRAEDNPNLPFCNTHWGEVLYRLKEHIEKA